MDFLQPFEQEDPWILLSLNKNHAPSKSDYFLLREIGAKESHPDLLTILESRLHGTALYLHSC